MELYVLRHAMAVDAGATSLDAERTLTDEGRERMRRATRCWTALGIMVDGIITSPYLRARETAQLAAEALGIEDCVEACPDLSPGAEPAEIVRAVTKRWDDDHRVMLVGHEPDLGRLISVLVCGDDRAGFRMKKAGLTKLVVDDLTAGRCAVLEWHLWPRHMLRMA